LLQTQKRIRKATKGDASAFRFKTRILLNLGPKYPFNLDGIMETTLLIVKPNGVRGGLSGEILSRFEKARLAISAIKMKQLALSDAEGFYAEHKERGFFGELVGFMTSGPVLLVALRGDKAVEKVRTMNGATNPAEAAPGTIRYDFAPSIGENVVHSSDSPASAQREVAYWFSAEEIVETPIPSSLLPTG
jgi:nucleoside-diphosphate kinase